MIYVTSDLHGRFDCLRALLSHVEFSDGDVLYIIGDVIDRHGRGGVDILLWLLRQRNVRLLLGNHENFLLSNRWIIEELDARPAEELNLDAFPHLSAWRASGGDLTVEALARYTTPEQRADIVKYLLDCPVFEDITVGGRRYVLVHAGLGEFSKDKPLEDYTPHDLLWVRPTMATVYDPEQYTVILGHTPTVVYSPQSLGRMLRSEGGWWNIDTGAALQGGSPMLLCLDTLREYYLEGEKVLTVG